MRHKLNYLAARDVDQVLVIDWCRTHADNNWTADDLRNALRQRRAIGYVSTEGETVTGFVVYEHHTDRVEIVRWGVHPAWDTVGAWDQLIGHCVAKLSRKRRALVVEVPESATAECVYLASLGFVAHDTGAGFLEFVFEHGQRFGAPKKEKRS